MPTGAEGTTLTLEGRYQDGTGTAVTPTTPLISIINPLGVTVVTDDVPTFSGSVGLYFYEFPIPITGPEGSWTAHWSGIINGAGVEADEVFQVVEAGDIVFPGQQAGSTCTAWADSSDATGPCADYDFDPAMLDQGMQWASDILYSLTGFRWAGECSDVIRPPSRCDCELEPCCCGRVSEYRLPGFPVLGVDQVLVDGAIIPPSRYRVDNHALLVYLPDPDDPSEPIAGWPRCQRADRPTTEDDTWQVSYTYGSPPPVGGRIAAALLGCQLALALVNDDRCALPAGTISATRQNLTIAVLDPAVIFPEGRTGISAVDLWIESVRYGQEHKPASVWVPGRRKGARRHTT